MKVAIIGGGACGVICAIKLKKNNPNLNVVIFEQNDRILKKVLKTGNGKCNITNHLISNDMYNDFSLIKNNEEINVTKELSDLGIVLKETTLGRVYPYSESSKTVINVLLRNLDRYGVNVETNYLVNDINYQNDKFIINKSLKFDYVVMATGSIAQEKTNGYSIMQKLGHKVSTLRPGLVPIITYEKTDHLQGIRCKVETKVNGRTLSGELLYKNDGLSGILSLDLSRLVKVDDIICFDLMPEFSYQEIKDLLNKQALDNYSVKELLEGIFSKVLVNEIMKRSKDLDSIIDNIKNFRFTVKGFKDFKEAQIVCGGVKVSEVNNDFSSRKIKNLYLGGELLDVDGASGGYNLFFAWLSGIVIANSINKKCSNYC